MADQWYYQLFGQEFGPVEFDDLAQRIVTGEVGADDLVRDGSAGEWIAVRSVAQFRNLALAVAVESADLATDIDSFMLVDEKERPQRAQPSSAVEVETVDDLAVDIDSFQVVDEELDINSFSMVDEAKAPAQKTAVAAAQVTPSTSHGQGSGKAVKAKPKAEADAWHYQFLGSEYGPVSLKELGKLIENADIGPRDLVRKGKRGDWAPAESVADLHPFFYPPEPEPEPVPAAPAPVTHSVPPPSPGVAGMDSVPPWLSGAGPAIELNWFCYINDQEYGPIALAELQSWVDQGQVTREMYLKHGVNGEWIAAEQVPHLKFAPPPAPEPEPEAPKVSLSLTESSASMAKVSLVDAEKTELVQQLLALVKQGLSAELMGGGQIAAPTAGLGWYCNISGSVIGPVSIESLVQMVLQKRLFPDDMIRMGPSGEWFPASSVPDLFPSSDGGKSKKSNYDGAESVMERIDRMYREGQEAEAKQAADRAKNPSKSIGSEPSKSNPAGDVLRQMSANIARGKTPEKSQSASLSELKFDAKTISVLIGVALIGAGIYFVPVLLSNMATKSAYHKLVAMQADVKKAEGSGTLSKSKELTKSIDEIAKSMKGGTTGSAKRDVARMARSLKEMVENVGKPAPQGLPPDQLSDYDRAKKAFDDYSKAAGRKLGLASGKSSSKKK